MSGLRRVVLLLANVPYRPGLRLAGALRYYWRRPGGFRHRLARVLESESGQLDPGAERGDTLSLSVVRRGAWLALPVG